MKNRIVFITLLTALALSGCATTKPSNDYGRPGELVDAALVTFNNFSADPNMTWFRNNIDRARAVIIFPRVVRAGFVFGGSGGSGTMLLRDQSTGEWTYPAFFSMGKGSFGFQAGVDVAEVVLMVMTQRGVDRFLSPSFQLGADASVAAGPVGAGASAALCGYPLIFTGQRGVRRPVGGRWRDQPQKRVEQRLLRPERPHRRYLDKTKRQQSAGGRPACGRCPQIRPIGHNRPYGRESAIRRLPDGFISDAVPFRLRRASRPAGPGRRSRL